MDDKSIKKEVLWEHLTEKLGRKLNAHETFIFHEIINLLDARALTAAPVAAEKPAADVEALEAAFFDRWGNGCRHFECGALAAFNFLHAQGHLKSTQTKGN